VRSSEISIENRKKLFVTFVFRKKGGKYKQKMKMEMNNKNKLARGYFIETYFYDAGF